MKMLTKTLDLAGTELKIELGKYAQAVDASVYATLGDTVILVTVGHGPESTLDYFPLTVDYVEKLYAGGIIKGSRWVKREGRPSDESILTGRLIDRSIRPLFPKTYKREVQVVSTLLSIDNENSPEILAAIATSLALTISSVPWNGPIATTRVGYIAGEYILNPSEKQRKESVLDLVVSSTKEKVLMIETGAKMVTEQIIEVGIEKAKELNARIIEFIEEIKEEVGLPKAVVNESDASTAVEDVIKKDFKDLYSKAVLESATSAGSQSESMDELIRTLFEHFQGELTMPQIKEAVSKFHFASVRKTILEDKKRPDGRALDEVRKLIVERSLLPRTHGSALFQRGETQVLSIATLGSLSLEQLIESPLGQETKTYMHHYSDGPYSYGQTGRLGSPSRRATGHGALAEKAIEPVLPTTEEFPYAIRVVSEILAENGSSSMGSICGSSLSLMDAGVPLKAPVAGLAMGIVTASDDEYVILTDIVGLEDFSGEMDFKIAGTAEGITAIQLDVKNKGLTAKMISEIFAQSKKARLQILEAMNAVMPSSSVELSKYAPKVVTLTPPADKIGAIIGPGGKMIRQITQTTGAEINIDDNGVVSISGVSPESVAAAEEMIKGIYTDAEKGKEYEGVVKGILPFGAIVEFMPGKEGLLHVSRLGKGFVKNVTDVVNEGDTLIVRVEDVDPRGKISLSLVEKKN